MSEELFQFVSRRDKDDPHNTTWIAEASDAELNEFSHKSLQYMNETMDLYDQQYAGRVMSLLEALEQRGLWNPDKLDSEQRKRVQDPGTPDDIRAIARQLSRVGHKLDASLDRPDTVVEPTDEKPADKQNQARIEDLKRRCRELAEDLRQFLEDHELQDKDEVMRRYRRNLGGRNLSDEASVLLEELEEHGLYPLKKLKSYELAANAYPRSPMAIGRLARTLGTIGNKP